MKNIYKFNINDLVVVKNEKNFVYKIIERYQTEEPSYLLKGVNYRLRRVEYQSNLQGADLNLIDLESHYSDKFLLNIKNNKDRKINQKYVIGKILHIDGDGEYLDKCLELYNEVGIYVYGVRIDEEEISDKIDELFDEVLPNVVIITGHDLYNNEGIKDIENYKNSKYFIGAIKKIRKRSSNCCIIAGACQSNFEALIASGADFASSPKRINIHTFDPVVIGIKVATTPFSRVVDMKDIYKYIENGKDAFGGLQTFGKMRFII